MLWGCSIQRRAQGKKDTARVSLTPEQYHWSWNTFDSFVTPETICNQGHIHIMRDGAGAKSNRGMIQSVIKCVGV